MVATVMFQVLVLEAAAVLMKQETQMVKRMVAMVLFLIFLGFL